VPTNKSTLLTENIRSSDAVASLLANVDVVTYTADN